MDRARAIERGVGVRNRRWKASFTLCPEHRVSLEGMLLKPNMVLSVEKFLSATSFGTGSSRGYRQLLETRGPLLFPV